jgi:hypothetical protein
MTTRLTVACAVAVALLAASVSTAATPRPIVTVARHGGLCVSGSECRTVLRITDTRISGPGYVPRRLKAAERSALLRSIRLLDLAAIRAHPFVGTCPIAYDGQESTYRFRGFAPALASCTYDLRRVQAVRLTERLLATLKPKPR